MGLLWEHLPLLYKPPQSTEITSLPLPPPSPLPSLISLNTLLKTLSFYIK